MNIIDTSVLRTRKMAGGEEVTTSRRRKILEHAADGVPHFRTAKVRKLPEPVDKNPFRNVIKWTWQLRLQVVLSAIFILPVRLILWLACALVIWVSAYIATYNWELDKPLGPCERVFLHIVTRVGLVLRIVSGYNWVHVKGTRASFKEAPIVAVAPHTSFMDIMVVATEIFSTSVVKAESINTPAVGTLIKLTEPILVHRSVKGGATAKSVVEKVHERLNTASQKMQILFFPEGTTTSGNSLITFKTGAFQLGLPVQPCLIRYASHWQTWTFIGPSGYASFLLTLLSPHNGLTVEFLPVYHPSDKERADAKLYANNVQKLMSTALGRPGTHHTYDDARLLSRGIELGLPDDTGLLEYTVVKDMTGLGFDDFLALLERFAVLDMDKDGLITASDFQSDLCWPVEEDVHAMFKEYDTSHRGRIDYREFVMGYNDLCKNLAQKPDTAMAVFKALSSGQNAISQQTLDTVFRSGGSRDAATQSFYSCLCSVESAGELQALFQQQPEYVYLAYNRFSLQV